VEVSCLTRARGRSPDEDVRLPVQGMMAEDERAKSRERHRRGKRQAARAGAVNGLRGAPYGSRSVHTHAGGGQARSAVHPEEARVGRPGFPGGGRARLSSGALCRRRRLAGARTRTGRLVWARRVGWAIWKNPASRGRAACGPTRPGPRRPTLRAPRGRPRPPRRARSADDGPAPDWMPIPGPALVEPEVCAAVQAQVEANRRSARPAHRGACALRQGVRPGPHWGDAFSGTPWRPRARQGWPRAYASDRWVGTDA
jgi:site-specific DNA recombinase